MYLNQRNSGRISLQSAGSTITGGKLVEFFGGSANSTSGIKVNRNNVTNLSAVWRALQVRSSAVAASQLRALDRTTLQVEDYPLFADVHPLFNTYQWSRQVVLDLDTAGDHFSLINRGRGSRAAIVESLFPLDPYKVQVDWLYAERDSIVPIGRQYTVHGVRGVSKTYTDDEVLHIPGLNFNGLRGMSVLAAASESLGTTMAAELYAGKLYGNGALMSGILSTDKRLEEEKAEAIKERFKAKISGMKNAGETVVLDSGLKFESLSINPVDAQFIQTRNFGIDEVARWFGVPTRYLHKAGDAASVKQQAEQDNSEFALHTLEGITRNIEAALNRIIPAVYKADFDLSRYDRGDTKTRSGAALLARKASYMSINEIRATEGKPPIDDERADDPFFAVDGESPESGGADEGNMTDDQGEGEGVMDPAADNQNG